MLWLYDTGANIQATPDKDSFKLETYMLNDGIFSNAEGLGSAPIHGKGVLPLTFKDSNNQFVNIQFPAVSSCHVPG